MIVQYTLKADQTEGAPAQGEKSSESKAVAETKHE
jgi:hypothetical protein